jgi:Helicase conserved C-terminal domain
MIEYEDFLASKRVLAPAVGFDVDMADLNPMLKPFQLDICQWALGRGKAAVFAHTGLGKGPIQLEWLHQVSKRANGNVLLLAPLAVSQQFQREAVKFHYNVTLCKTQDDVRAGINVTNYDRLDLFDIQSFCGVAMDESSCIKDWSSKTSHTLIEKLRSTPYKLCSTATPSPNDHSELGTHAELLDVLTRSQMLAMFFEHDGGNTSKWNLKGHAKKPFWKWVASWAVCLKLPSDLGHDDTGYVLPPLNFIEHIVTVDQSVSTEGMLFRCPDLSATGLHKEMRLTCADRARAGVQIISESCKLNPNDDTLSVWDGNQSTKRTGDAKENLTQNMTLGSRSSGNVTLGPQKKIRSTCKSTTPTTNKNGLPSEGRTGTRLTHENENCTDLTQRLGNTTSINPTDTTKNTPKSDSTKECASMVSPDQTITESSPPNMGHVQYADLPDQGERADSTLIIATQQGNREGFCAPTATLDSESFNTTPPSLEWPQGLSKPLQWIVWCNTNYEQKPLKEMTGDSSISIDGSMSPEKKEKQILRWLDNERPVLLTKPSVAGYGLNLQQCHSIVFVGLGYSFEQFFQAVRRCWRFGQEHPVDVHIVIAETEGPVLANIRKKEAAFEELQAGMVEAMQVEQLQARRKETKYDHLIPTIIPDWLKTQEECYDY